MYLFEKHRNYLENQYIHLNNANKTIHGLRVIPVHGTIKILAQYYPNVKFLPALFTVACSPKNSNPRVTNARRKNTLERCDQTLQ